MDISYKLTPYSPEIHDAYLRLLPQQEQVIARGKLDWKLKNHPGGDALIAIASTVEQGVVGVNTFMPVRCTVEDKTVQGFQSMDTVVSSEARGQGVFTKLVECFYANTDGSVLYGFPNLSSSTGFFGKLGWTKFGMVPMLFRPLRTGYFTSRAASWLPNIKVPVFGDVARGVSRPTKFDQAVTDVWNDFSSSIRCSVRRDATFLNWRLYAHPTERYTVLQGAHGSIAAYTVVPKHGGQIGYLMEAFGEDEEVRGLITLALREMQDAGADAALAWCLPWSPNYRAHRRAGFYPLPEKLRPIKINFGARPLNADAAAAGEARSWYISYLDSDTV